MNERPSILIVEDETHLAQGLLYNLRAEGYTVEIAGDGESALEILTLSEIDAVILDVMLPGRDGFSVAAELRSRQNYLPILMLTARGRPEDILRGFDAGADDYLAKPFDLSVLLARLNGLLRRVSWHRPPVSAPASMSSGAPARQDGASNDLGPEFSFAERTIDFDNLELRTQKKTIRLTLMECDLLRYLVRNRGRIVSRRICSSRSGAYTRIPTPAPSTTSWCVCGGILKTIPHPRSFRDGPGVGYRFLPEGGERP